LKRSASEAGISSLSSRNVRGLKKKSKAGFFGSPVASSGEEAVAWSRKKGPDLVLMDFSIPGALDGVKTAEIIRSKYDIPIIFLIDSDEIEELGRVALSFPFSFILKPIQVKYLKLTIEMSFKHTNAEKTRSKAEKELIEKNRELQDIIDTMPALVFHKDKQDRFLQVNKNFSNFFGLASDKMIGKTAWEISPVENFLSYWADDIRG
jgi:CheY-like chemotaxis protein